MTADTATKNRKPSGSPQGGQWAPGSKTEAGDQVVDGLDGWGDNGPEAATDRFGNELSRGGFPRNAHTGAALVTHPDGDLYQSGKNKGQIKMEQYSSPSGYYTNPSTAGLDRWRQNNMLKALRSDPDFADRVAKTLDGLEAGSADEKAALTDLRDEADELSAAQIAAERGTFAHTLTELSDDGSSVAQHVGDHGELGIDADAAERFLNGWDATHDRLGLRSVAVEQSIVNDDFRAAGTTDRLYQLDRPLEVNVDGQTVTLPEGAAVIGDLKTGSVHTYADGTPKYWQRYSCQLAIYAGGKPYDPVEGQRGEWPDGLQPRQDVGLIIHADLDAVENGASDDAFSVYAVDLNAGRCLASVSKSIRDTEKEHRRSCAPIS